MNTHPNQCKEPMVFRTQLDALRRHLRHGAALSNAVWNRAKRKFITRPKYVIDHDLIARYFAGKDDNLPELIRAGAALSPISLPTVVASLNRPGCNEKLAQDAVDLLRANLQIAPLGKGVVLRAIRIRLAAEPAKRLAWADAVQVALAESLGAALVTRRPAFRAFKACQYITTRRFRPSRG